MVKLNIQSTFVPRLRQALGRLGYALLLIKDWCANYLVNQKNGPYLHASLLIHPNTFLSLSVSILPSLLAIRAYYYITGPYRVICLSTNSLTRSIIIQYTGWVSRNENWNYIWFLKKYRALVDYWLETRSVVGVLIIFSGFRICKKNLESDHCSRRMQ